MVEALSMYGLNSPSLFFYSYCAKVHFYPDVKKKSIVFMVYGLFSIACLISEMGCHLAILLKQTSIEKRANVYVIKNNRLVSNHRHTRNIVSALGHFATFAICMVQLFLLMNAFVFFIEDKEMLVSMRSLTMFFMPATEFLIYPLIETIFSERLRSTLPFMSCGN